MSLNKHNRRLYVISAVFILAWLHRAGAVPLTTTPAQAATATPTPTPTSTTSRYANPLLEHKYERNCKALCEHCGCLGFYCGEECICECNNENSDTECIHTMQLNARKLDIPFEILIQGPSKNNFVRNALQFEQKCAARTERSTAPGKDAINNTRNRRSTITIYKPRSANDKRAPLAANALAEITEKKPEATRHKRSVDHLEWFSDLASNLVRPAPFGIRSNKEREEKTTRQSSADVNESSHREPWYLEANTPRLTRPAPLRKRHQFSQASKTKKSPSFKRNTSGESKSPAREIRPLRDALEVVENIPRVLQDTVSCLTSDNGHSGDVFSLNIMNDVLPKPMGRRGEKRSKSKPVLDQSDLEDKIVVAKTTVAPTPFTPFGNRGMFLPWWRQQRLRFGRRL